jgi:hypothetical protein
VTPSEIAAAISALETALASGELTVEYNGRRVTYRSSSEIVSALNHFKRESQGVPASGPAPATASRTTYASFERD